MRPKHERTVSLGIAHHLPALLAPRVQNAAAAGITLTAELVQLSRSIRKAVKKMRYTRTEAENLADEMEIFADLYFDLLNPCRTGPQTSKRASISIERLKIWVENAIEGFEKLMGALDEDAEYSLLDTLTARRRWHRSESVAKCLRASLMVARESIACFTNIRNIEHLCELLDMLETAVTEEQRRQFELKCGTNLELIKDELKYRRRQRHRIDRRLQKAKEQIQLQSESVTDEELMPPTKDLFKLTQSVEKYAQHILPMEEAGQRPRASLRAKSRRTIEGNPVLSSQSTATTHTQRTEASNGRALPPESPPTSPEPPSEDSPSTLPVTEELYPEFPKYCPKCSGALSRVEARGTNIIAPALETSSVAPKYHQREASIYDSISTDVSTRESTPSISHKPNPRPPPHRTTTRQEAPAGSPDGDKVTPTREHDLQSEQENSHAEHPDIDSEDAVKIAQLTDTVHTCLETIQTMGATQAELQAQIVGLQKEREEERARPRDQEQQAEFRSVALVWEQFPPGWRVRHQNRRPEAWRPSRGGKG